MRVVNGCNVFAATLLFALVCGQAQQGFDQDDSASVKMKQTPVMVKNQVLPDLQNNIPSLPSTDSHTTIPTTVAPTTHSTTTTISSTTVLPTTTKITTPPSIVSTVITSPLPTELTTEVSTTAKVSTATPPASSTTPSTPHDPPTGSWSVSDDKNETRCILFKAGIRLTLVIKGSSPEPGSTETVNIPANADASGSCDAGLQNITLHFTRESSYDVFLTFIFSRLPNDTKYDLHAYSLQFMDKLTTGIILVDKFVTPDQTRYQCLAKQTIFESPNVTGLIGEGSVKIEAFQLQFEAFRHSNSTDFSTSAEKCSADTMSRLVPIIVGAALGGLIVIVLIAYIIGRKRSKKGYESV